MSNQKLQTRSTIWLYSYFVKKPMNVNGSDINIDKDES